jgi:4-hydroxy-tetrahydrodipicolinate reductase
MKIALIGYGKMGVEIESVALKKEHEIVLRIGAENKGELTRENLQKADVAIEFSTPEAAFENIVSCFKAGIPVVSGTTGWLDKMDELKAICVEHDGGLLYSSNFSLGVNIFFHINRALSKIMARFPEYDVMIEEIHHTEKKDAPSGTAITLANDIIDNHHAKNNWVVQSENESELRNSGDEIIITSKRMDSVPGIHHLTWHSSIDRIEISHVAHNRKGFALGALFAAEWMTGKKGIFALRDALNI